MIALQRWLPFGAEQHFELLHGRHSAGVSICQKRKDEWHNGHVYEHGQAADIVAQLAANGASNVYQSQNGFTGSRRLNDRVAALTSCYVDLDTYNVPGLESVTATELLDKALTLAPWLPVPTAVIYSGRGYYFDWMFKTPLGPEDLPRWQWVEDRLIDSLATLGADVAVRDAARVKRVVGTINSKSGRPVEGYLQTADPMSFSVLERKVKSAFPALSQRAAHSPAQVSNECLTIQRTHAPSRKYFLLWGGYHQKRMADYRQLAQLRGPHMSDCRSRLLFAYAVSGAWFWADRAQAEGELSEFACEYFKDGHRYTAKRVGTVLERMAQAKAGIAQIWKGHQVSRRYKTTTRYVLELLEVSEDEQKHMAVLIGGKQKEIRRIEKRREQGVEPRDTYRGRAVERRSEARRLRQSGLTQAQIAAMLGVAQSSVSAYLKG
jgi:hypothetical protein